MKQWREKSIEELKKTPDSAIDYSDIPQLGDDFWKKAKLVQPARERISLNVDKDILQFFRKSGRGYQTRINAILRHFMEHSQ